jgi:putative PIN family toxin of toxin-antitoxin system
MHTLILDTNVVLDLLVFRDPGVAAIERALADVSAVCITDAECRAEFVRVLIYPHFALDESARREALAAYDRLVCHAPDLAIQTLARIPHCADPDDQKFLALAYRCDADIIVTKDHALLDLARATREHFHIVEPAAAAALLAATGNPAGDEL